MAAPKEIIVGLVGNPNCGKTTIFNALTGAHQKVANWSGVTVEKREGRLRRGEHRMRIIDLPGTYSLSSFSIEEIITRNFIIEEQPDVIINVVDAGNLDRNLYLTTQLITMRAPVVLALNMFDEAQAKGLSIDTEKLGTLLGMPVVRTVGTHSVGIGELIEAVIEVAGRKTSRSRHLHIPFGEDIEREIKRVQQAIWKEDSIGRRYSTRWLAVRLIEGDEDIEGKLSEYPNAGEILAQAKKSRSELEAIFHDDMETVVSERRYGFIAGALHESVRRTPLKRVDLSERIDMVITNRFLGFPLLFLFLWALFHLTFSLGEYPKSHIEAGVGQLGSLVQAYLPAGPVKDLIVNGIIGGVGGVIVFLPNILILFMGISLMEDTGYMARAAFIMDRIMHSLGLHGKSFIPLVMGFGCNVPAIMATRSLENREDRILTILINPFMSCSARLPVYILFAGVFFHRHAGTVILSLYAIGISLAFLSARLHKLLFFRKESSPFVMELPPYRIPTARSIALHVWDRSSQYLRKMGGIILAFSILIWAMGSYPKSPAVEREYTLRLSSLETRYAATINHARPSEKDSLEGLYRAEKSALLADKAAAGKKHTFIGKMGELIHPIIRPLGLNWQMGVSLITGLVAKEIVVSTMGVLYHVSDDPSSSQRTLAQALKEEDHGVTPLSAFTFMLFVLLYVPCLATIVVIGREAGWGWALFSIAYQLIVAWLVCFAFYSAASALGA